MAAFEVETIPFDSADTEPVVEEMRRLTARGGLGWINVRPRLRDDHIDRLPQPTTLGRWFSGRGPAVPMATWTPASGGRRPSPVVVGLEHGTGPNALDRLREAGAPLPQGWRKVQDHAKRGIVAEPGPGAGRAEVLRWLLSACRLLCRVDVDDDWIAEVHRPGPD